MARHVRRYLAFDAAAQEIEVTGGVQDLVAYRLVREAQLGVDHTFLAEEHEIVEAASECKTLLLKRADVTHESERPRRSDLALVRLDVVQHERHSLSPDRGRI